MLKKLMFVCIVESLRVSWLLFVVVLVIVVPSLIFVCKRNYFNIISNIAVIVYVSVIFLCFIVSLYSYDCMCNYLKIKVILKSLTCACILFKMLAGVLLLYLCV